MHKERTKENIYDVCIAEGSYLPLSEFDENQIRDMIKLAFKDLETAKKLIKISTKDSDDWNAIYKLHYDALHTIAEALVRIDKIKIKTHECLFAYLCQKHSELEFNWEFFETIRSKRNRSTYYGESISKEQWKNVELQMNLYIKTLKNALEMQFASSPSFANSP
ncbi:hypothetical protein COV18_01590 [Candidatus Woesearchaeota archaeon CG10_big_fil_rev_8_21_14_0_10_37_12]|nr:MAG: hypothetical protein COV18_01590 [Candidatus Woesearchaeota archaeon CG10_big_fil_rev_8_21_14_0_10_37_12]